MQDVLLGKPQEEQSHRVGTNNVFQCGVCEALNVFNNLLL